jgi:type IV secretion system protein VirB6
MNEAAPIAWIIAKINAIIQGGAGAAATALAAKVAPIFAACFGIYIILIALNYIRGAEENFVGDLMYRVLGFSLILAICVNASSYVSFVMPLVTGLGGELASALTGGSVNETSLDTLVLSYVTIVNDGFDAVGLLDKLENPLIYIELVVKAAIVLISLIPFLVSATLMLIVASVGSQIIAMVGPLYMGFLLFPATRQYFSAWLNSAFSYALIPVIVGVISIIAVGISIEMLGTAPQLAEISFKLLIFCAIGNLLLVYLMKYIGSLASSLSAGGINVGGGASLGQMSSAAKSGVQGAANQTRAASAASVAAAKYIRNKFNGSGGSIKAG